jgi:hypothetical protein
VGTFNRWRLGYGAYGTNIREGTMKALGLAAFAAVVLIAGEPSSSWAHSTGHESRTVAECERLPGSAEAGERAQCLKCVQRPKKHHYHPDYPAGDRCRPDDGKP